MKINLPLIISSEDLNFSFTEKLAKSIYFELMESKEALEYATEVIKENDYRTITVEDVLWDEARYNAERLRFLYDYDVEVEFRRFRRK